MVRESAEHQSYCCCCCKRPKKNPRKNEVAEGDKIVSNAETLLPTLEHNVSNSQLSFHSQHDQKKEKSQQCAHNCFKCGKKFMTFFFSNIGLCSLVVAYSVLGGFIFKHLEAPYELEKRHQVAGKRAMFVRAIWNMTQSDFYFFEPNYTRDTELILLEFQKEVLAATKEGWDGTDGNVEPQWSFPGSLLYSVTVITTIGYGHIAPKTVYGRLVTMLYALVGIPLTLLFIANTGAFLSDCFRLLYKQTCRLLTWLCCPPDQGANKKNNGAVSRSIASQELAPLQIRASNNHIDKLDVENLPVKQTPSTNKLAVNTGGSQSGSRSEINIVVDDFDYPKTKQKAEQIRVPIFVSVMIMALYIFGGALMFSMWEDWDYLEGSYFCFITLSTVGFGDYVPGSIGRTDSESSRNKLIICCVYLMFGLSIIAMCFNLMQEDVRAKFVWLGEQIGLIDKKR